MAETFPSYPPCCRKVLRELAASHKTGTRNCATGHSVNLATARRVEAAAAAAKADPPAKPTGP